MTLPTSLVPVTLPESSMTQAHRLSLLLSYRILYIAVSFGLTLGRDVSAKEGWQRESRISYESKANIRIDVVWSSQHS